MVIVGVVTVRMVIVTECLVYHGHNSHDRLGSGQ